MMAALGGAAVGAPVGTSFGAVVELGRGDDAGAVADSDSGFRSGAAVGWDEGADAGTDVGSSTRVCGEAPVGLLTAAASDDGALVGDRTVWLACVVVVGAWVALVPQPITPITIAINGRASSRDISRLYLTVQVDAPDLGFRAVTQVNENDRKGGASQGLIRNIVRRWIHRKPVWVNFDWCYFTHSVSPQYRAWNDILRSRYRRAVYRPSGSKCPGSKRMCGERWRRISLNPNVPGFTTI